MVIYCHTHTRTHAHIHTAVAVNWAPPSHIDTLLYFVCKIKLHLRAHDVLLYRHSQLIVLEILIPRTLHNADRKNVFKNISNRARKCKILETFVRWSSNLSFERERIVSRNIAATFHCHTRVCDILQNKPEISSCFACTCCNHSEYFIEKQSSPFVLSPCSEYANFSSLLAIRSGSQVTLPGTAVERYTFIRFLFA